MKSVREANIQKLSLHKHTINVHLKRLNNCVSTSNFMAVNLFMNVYKHLLPQRHEKIMKVTVYTLLKLFTI